jgi:poly(hydroxyalkanoate) granule-associated protein
MNMAARRKPRTSPPVRKTPPGATQVIRDAFETAQVMMQTRVESVRDQAGESWDNLEALFQSRVQKALRQIGVPNADEVRLLTRRVAELNATVQKLAAKQAKPARRAPRRNR